MAASERAPSRIYPILFLLAALVVVGLVVVRVLSPFVSAIAWAIVLAVAFRAPWRWIERRLPGRKGLAAALAVAGIGLLVILPAAALAGVLAAQAADAATRVAAELKKSEIKSLSDVVSLPAVAKALEAVESRVGVTREEVLGTASEAVKRVSTFAAQASGGIVLGFLDALITFFTTLFLLFFLFRDGDAYGTALTELLPLDAEGRAAVATSLGSMLQAIFRGSLLCALAQGLAGGVGWSLVGLSSPVLAGAVMAVLSLLPVGGTALVWLPGALWLFSQGRTGAAIFLIAWGAIVASFLADNVLKPMLIGGTAELSTVVVFVGVFGGLSAFGLLGLFLGPISLAVGVTLIDVLRRESKRSAATDVPA